MRPKQKFSKSNRSLHLNISSRKLVAAKSPDQNLTTPRNCLRHSERSLKLAQLQRPREGERELVVQIQSDALYDELSLYSIRGLVRFDRQKVCERKELFVISKIQEFYMQYNSYFDLIYSNVANIRWIILTNAINNREIEEEFNRNYEPITFTFLRDIQDIANYFNFPHASRTCQKLNYFSKIINFANFSNDFATVFEQGERIQCYRPDQNKQLWLVSKEQLKKISINPHEVCYMGENSLKGTQIEVIEAGQQKLTYLLIVQSYEVFLHTAGIKELEDAITPQYLRRALLRNQDKAYYKKVIQNCLPHEVVLNLVNFPTKVAEMFGKYESYVIVSQNLSFCCRTHVYTVHYGQRAEVDQLSAVFDDKNGSLEDEILRIKHHFQAIAKIQDEYEQLSPYFASFSFAKRDIREQSLIDELQYFTGKRVLPWNELNDNEQKPIILIGRGQEIPSSNVTFINITNFSCDNWLVHKEVIRIIKKLNTIYHNPNYNFTSVTNFSSQLKELEERNQIYSNKSIKDFVIFLQDIKENTSHLVIMEMNEYTQQRQQHLRESQLRKNVTIEVYLQYGNEFIFRTKNNKYTFLKKQQLLKKIQDIIRQNARQDDQTLDFQYRSECDNKFYSDVNYGRELIKLEETYSTPNLTYYFPASKTQIIICVPKGVPHYSLMSRSVQSYSLLVYSRPEQVLEMIKYLPSDHFAAIIIDQTSSSIFQPKMGTISQNCNTINSTSKLNYQLIFVTEVSQKYLRNEVDNLIDRFALQKKQSSFSKNTKKLPVLILYSHNDDKQMKALKKMGDLFRNSKIITMSKKDFKTINKSYSISQNMEIYQIGRPQISGTKRLKTILEIFQVYMNPQIGIHQYTTEKIQFSMKQLFIRQLLDKVKKSKINRINEVSLNRSLSPKGKKILQKECFASEAGLVMLESKSTNKLTKKEKFNGYEELISLTLLHLSKGSQIIVVISEQEFFELKDKVEHYSTEITWIVLVNDFKKCIIRQANIIFCKDDQFEHALAILIQSYRSFKKEGFIFSSTLKQSGLSFQSSDVMKNYKNGFLIDLANFTPSSPSSQQKHKLNICLNEAIKQYQLQKLKSDLIFNNSLNLQNILSFFLPSRSDSPQKQEQSIYIVCDQHNKRFLQQSLELLRDTRYMLLTFEHIGNIISYSNPCKTIFVFEKGCNIRHSNTILVPPSETAEMFSKRLKLFLGAVRNY